MIETASSQRQSEKERKTQVLYALLIAYQIGTEVENFRIYE